MTHSPTSIEFHTKGLSAAQTSSDTCTRSFPPGLDHVDALPPLVATAAPAAALPLPAENLRILLPAVCRASCWTLLPNRCLGRALGRKHSACHGATSSRSSTRACCMIRPCLADADTILVRLESR